MEFALAFPVLLVLILGCVQFAHLWAARLVVHYAAYCAARAALVTVCDSSGPGQSNESWPRRNELPHEGLNAQFCVGSAIAGRQGAAASEAEWAACKAASRVCAWIVMGGAGNETADVDVPDWGRIPGSDAVERKTRASVRFEQWNVEATVEHDFALIAPIVGPMIAWGMNPWDENEPWKIWKKDVTGDVHLSLDLVSYPHIRLTETVWLPKPYRTDIAAGNWDGYPLGTHSGTGW